MREDGHGMNVINYRGFRFRNPREKDVAISTETHTTLQRIFWILDNMWNAKWCYETVDIRDARRLDLSFEKTGFTLMKLDKPSSTSNWRDTVDIEKFRDEIRPEILKRFPGACRIEFSTFSVVRGGDCEGDKYPLIDGPHLDYTQDDDAREEYYKRYSIPNAIEHEAVLGLHDTDDEEVRTVVGIWKPVYMKTPVGDFPLALMDASTFKPEDERLLEIHQGSGDTEFNGLDGLPVFSPDQRWYYYPFQTDQEVLLFTHYTKGRFFCNPHCSFASSNYPESFDSRVSFEMRAVIFYPNEKKSGS